MYICELDACETNYAPKGPTWLKKLEICTLYAEMELNIDDWTFLMAITNSQTLNNYSMYYMYMSVQCVCG